MASAISTARANLYAALAAAAPTSSTQSPELVQVTYGAPSMKEDQEVIYMAGIRDPSEQFAALGNQRKEERFVLEVKIKAHNPAATDPATVDARGLTLAETVRSVVSANAATLAGAAVREPAQVISQTTDGVVPAEGGGYVIFLTVLVLVSATIS